jgi:hypothetical protein
MPTMPYGMPPVNGMGPPPAGYYYTPYWFECHLSIDFVHVHVYRFSVLFLLKIHDVMLFLQSVRKMGVTGRGGRRAQEINDAGEFWCLGDL